MKVLSIRQPWAWLIANGFKDIENRTWKTNFRGEFYIHAAIKFDMEGYGLVQIRYPYIDMPRVPCFKQGGIVGKAKIVYCANDHPSSWFFGPWGFVLTNQKRLPFVPCKGKLRFFEEPRCRVCGCTSYDACPGGCFWIEPNLCSKCEGKE